MDQFKNFIVLLLAVAGVAAFVLNENIEGVAIFVVLLINGLIGFVTEMGALNSMESLQEMIEIEARVRREGEVRDVSAEELVPGDVVVLNAGNAVPADLRVIEPSKLQADESTLTGESVPVGKTIDVLGGTEYRSVSCAPCLSSRSHGVAAFPSSQLKLQAPKKHDTNSRHDS